MNNYGYGPPVDRLLTYGDCRETMGEWPDYRALGIGPEHIPDLIRMAADETLSNLPWDENETAQVETWAPIHAWRALGQLQAEAAAEPLTRLFARADSEFGDDWVLEELPEVFGMIGAATIPPLAAYLNKQSHGLFARITASNGLKEIALRHPDARAACVAALITELERFKRNNRELNGFIIGDLMELKATEALPVIERAFAAKRVDTFVVGDWDSVQVDFGLKEAPPPPTLPPEPISEEDATRQMLKSLEAIVQRAQRAEHKRVKKKRRQADKARRKSRKKR